MLSTGISEWEKVTLLIIPCYPAGTGLQAEITKITDKGLLFSYGTQY